MTFKKIKFVTDSVADIPADMVEKWNITVVPAFVNYGDSSYADDGVALVREDYYAKLGSMRETPTTSAMPSELAREMATKAFEDADHLIILTTPAKLSGIYNSMRLGIADLPQSQITLMDSGQISLGMGWQVLLGAEVAAETGDVAKTLDTIKRVRDNQRLYAGLATLEFLRRSGRVGWAAANIGALLRITPVLKVVEGDVIPLERVRTFKRVIDKMEELIRAEAPIDRIAMLHINNEDSLNELRDRLSDVLPPDAITGTICPTIGTHTGPGTIGAALVKKGWRD
jgi:DegV family protein with EDD domain